MEQRIIDKMNQAVNIYLIVCAELLTLGSACVVDNSSDTTVAILNHVTSWYRSRGQFSKCSRPVPVEGPTVVEYRIGLVQLLNLDVKGQLLTGQFWETHTWKDHRMQWDPDKFGGKDSVTMFYSEEIWKPDIFLYNQLSTTRDVDASNLVIQNNGSVVWVPSTIYSVPCEMDITYFPWDSHTCTLTFGSWSQSNKDIIMKPIETGPEGFIMNNEWEVEQHPHELVDTEYPPYGFFSQYVYKVTFKRRLAFFTFAIVLPSVLMSFMTLVLFCLPPDFQDKLSIALSLLLSYFVLLMIVVDSTPRAGLAIPLIGQYLFVCIGLLGLSIVACTITYNLAVRTDARRLTKRTKGIINTLARSLWLSVKTENMRPLVEGGSDSDTASCGKLSNHSSVNYSGNQDWNLTAQIVQRLFLILFLLVNIVTLLYVLISFMYM